MRLHYEGMMCVDCLFYLANGDVPDKRPNLPQEIAAMWDPKQYDLVCGSSGENDQDEEEFSIKPCRCCGSLLAGSRHPFAVLTPETNKVQS